VSREIFHEASNCPNIATRILFWPHEQIEIQHRYGYDACPCPALTGHSKRPPVWQRSMTEAASHPRRSISNDPRSAVRTMQTFALVVLVCLAQ